MRTGQIATLVALLASTPALAQQAAPSLPPLPQAPAATPQTTVVPPPPALPALPGAAKGPAPTIPPVQPVDTGDSNPAPACATPMIVDKVFDFSSRAVQDAYHRSLYGKVLNVSETESRGTRRRCSGEVSDSDGWTYPLVYVIDKPSADQVEISYDFSHIKPPPKLAVPVEPSVPPSALPAPPVVASPGLPAPPRMPPAPTVR